MVQKDPLNIEFFKTFNINYIAIFSRLFVILVSATSSIFFESYDSSATLVLSNPNSYLGRILSGFTAWDGVHFLSIAKNGYIFEQQFAFLPLFPILVRFGGLFGNLRFI